MVAAARLVQFLAAAVLFGSPLFMLYGLPRARLAGFGRAKTAFAAAAFALLAGAGLALALQTAVMTGEPAAAFVPADLWSVLSGTQFGLAVATRLALAAAALVLCLSVPPSGPLWGALSVLGGLALASFAWSGHGAADDGPAGLVHLSSDVVHLLAAGVWLGALAMLAGLLARRRLSGDRAALEALRQGLGRFSGVGSTVVAALVLTGLVNGWFLVGPRGLPELFRTAYGLMLVAKLALFAGMLALAAANRFVFTPRLAKALEEGSAGDAVSALRRSVGLETVLGVLVLALVGALGAIEPVAAMT